MIIKDSKIEVVRSAANYEGKVYRPVQLKPKKIAWLKKNIYRFCGFF